MLLTVKYLLIVWGPHLLYNHHTEEFHSTSSSAARGKPCDVSNPLTVWLCEGNHCHNVFIFRHGMLALTNCSLVGVFFMLMAGTCFLHCWQNFAGEMTLFGDRQTYGVGSVILYCTCCIIVQRHGGGVWIIVAFTVNGTCSFMTGSIATSTKT